MNISIDNPATLGKLVRACRKAQKIRQDDAAGSLGVSENFLGKVERGSGAVQWGKLFQVLDGLGIQLTVDVPDDVAMHFSTTASRQP
jgi:transcriptional regulator with XRE-family HTH domain